MKLQLDEPRIKWLTFRYFLILILGSLTIFAKHQVLSYDVLATSHVLIEKYEQRLEDVTRKMQKLSKTRPERKSV